MTREFDSDVNDDVDVRSQGDARRVATAFGNDVLFDSVLLPGAIVPIVFYYAASCASDIQLGYLDGSTQEYIDGQNLCRTTAIRFKPRRMSWTNGGSL